MLTTSDVIASTIEVFQFERFTRVPFEPTLSRSVLDGQTAAVFTALLLTLLEVSRTQPLDVSTVTILVFTSAVSCRERISRRMTRLLPYLRHR